MTTIKNRFLDSTITGQIREGDGLTVRISQPLTMSRDGDGSWIVYSMCDGLPEGSKALMVNDPAACATFDALFELVVNPVDFTEQTIGEAQEPSEDAA